MIFLGIERMTIIFQDGFESGDFTAWNGTVTSAGCTAVVNTNLPHHGLDSAQFTVVASAGFAAYVKKTIAAANRVYARGYFQWDVTGNYYDCLRLNSSGTTMLDIAPIDGGTWNTKYRSGATYTGPITVNSVVFRPNEWVCVEAYCFIDGANGAYALYFNGTLFWSIAGLVTNGYGGITDIYWGEIFNGAANVHTTTLDCCVIDENYIGPQDVFLGKGRRRIYRKMSRMGYGMTAARGNPSGRRSKYPMGLCPTIRRPLEFPKIFPSSALSSLHV